MKVLKVFLAVILSFLLLCAQGALMGVIACNEAISSDSIAKAVQETDFTNQISQQKIYKKLYFRNEKFCGGVLLGDVDMAPELVKAYEEKSAISELKL